MCKPNKESFLHSVEYGGLYACGVFALMVGGMHSALQRGFRFVTCHPFVAKSVPKQELLKELAGVLLNKQGGVL